jgi:hypothetical protein
MSKLAKIQALAEVINNTRFEGETITAEMTVTLCELLDSIGEKEMAIKENLTTAEAVSREDPAETRS